MSVMNKIFFRFVFGAMGCGKTSQLTGDYYSNVCEGKNVLIVKHGVDSKGEDCIETRGGTKIKANFVLKDNDNIYELICKYLYDNPIDLILVDEIEFMSEEQIIQLSRIVDNLGIPVIAYGIITDFKGKMFPGAILAMEYADDFKYLPVECSCGNLKNRNMRLENGVPVFDGEQVSIDGVGNTTYVSKCRACYTREKRKVLRRVEVDI